MHARIIAAFFSILVAAPAMAADSGLPACDDPAVLARIVERQHWAERNTWQDGVRITGIHAVRQRYNGTRFVSAIEHRHCEAKAELAAARDDRLYYVISREQGFAGISWYVDFCLPRHDPYRVYNAGCRVLK